MKDSETIIFEGVCLYANVPPREAQKAMETEDTGYSIQVECSEAKFKELRKKGIPALTQLKTWPEDYHNKTTGQEPPECKQAEGKSFIRVKATKLKVKDDGKVIEFTDIPVVNEYGETITDSIANGSKVQVKATLDPIKGRAAQKALRLKAVLVTDLIPYVSDYNPLEGLAIKERKGGDKSQAAAGFLGD